MLQLGDSLVSVRITPLQLQNVRPASAEAEGDGESGSSSSGSDFLFKQVWVLIISTSATLVESAQPTALPIPASMPSIPAEPPMTAAQGLTVPPEGGAAAVASPSLQASPIPGQRAT